MVSWVWIPVAVLMGASLGAILMGLCCANDRRHE